MSQKDLLLLFNDTSDILSISSSTKKDNNRSMALLLFEACKLATRLQDELFKLDPYKNWYQIVKYQLCHPLSTIMALRRQDQFVHEKRKLLTKKLNEIINIIGSIMLSRKNNLYIDIKSIEIDKFILKNDKPWWIRYENVILKFIVIFGGIFAIRRIGIKIGILKRLGGIEIDRHDINISTNYKTFIEILKNLHSTLINYIDTWIIIPACEIWDTINYSTRDISKLTGNRTLNSITANLTEDIQALNEMIADYTGSFSPASSSFSITTSPSNSNGIKRNIMEAYRENIKAPIRNLIRGDLLQLFLIQVQQTKVELETAMVALDKLLKSNKLNFELLALIPAIGLFWLAIDGVWSIWKWILSRSSKQILLNLKGHIHKFEAYLDNLYSPFCSSVSSYSLFGEDNEPREAINGKNENIQSRKEWKMDEINNAHLEGCKMLLIFKMFKNVQELGFIDFVRNDLASLAIHQSLDQRWIIYRMNKKLKSFLKYQNYHI